MTQALWDWDLNTFRVVHLQWMHQPGTVFWQAVSAMGLAHLQSVPLLAAWLARKNRLWDLLLILGTAAMLINASTEGATALHTIVWVVCVCMFRFVSPKAAKAAFMSFLTSGLLHLVLKSQMYRMRPSNLSDAIPLENVYATASFPSGHTCTSTAIGFALFMALSSENKRFLGALFLTWGLLVGVSRVVVGVHWPTDVIAGSLVGLFSAALIRRVA